MCLYPKLLLNPKFKANKKNGGNIPPVNDVRTLYVPIGCKICIECRKQKANEYRVRLYEDIRVNKNAVMVTLTFSDESYIKLSKETTLTGYARDNYIATRATRYFTERWRKKHKKTIRHLLITELGHEGTENIHMHGLVWCNNPTEIEKYWKYGYVHLGQWVNEQTVNYIVKYITKTDVKHKHYYPIVLASNGLGEAYIHTARAQLDKTRGYYTTKSGHKLAIPLYYKNKLYNDEEKENLWIEKLNEQKRYVLGQQIDISKTQEEYYKALKTAQKKNKELGNWVNPKNWELKKYEEQLRNIKHTERKERYNNKKKEN